MNSLGEHEKQAYHEFDPIKEETRNKEFNKETKLIGEDENYEVYRLYVEGIKGIDPCMTFDERIRRKDKTESKE